MSLKEQAFELFAKGKKPSDPEVKLLGLASSTANKYYSLFRGQTKPTIHTESPTESELEAQPETQPEVEIEVVAAPALVPLDSLKVTELFTLNGDLYRVVEVTSEFVRATKLRAISYDVNATMLLAVGQATLATYTKVKPVQK